MSLVFQEGKKLSEETTLRVGGEVKYFVALKTEKDLEEISDFVAKNNLPFVCVGGGSNLLFSDAGFSGLIIKNILKGVVYEEVDEEVVRLVSGAGEVLDEVVEDTVLHNFWGLENLSAIPGNVGATPVQNVGAYGVEVSNLIDFVEVFHLPTKTFKKFSNSECKFGYRDSFFKTKEGREYIILKVAFLLRKKSNPKIDYADLARFFASKKSSQREIRAAVTEIRAGKFPDWTVLGTAGSFFKNPVVTGAESEAFRTRYPEVPTYKTIDGKVKISLGFVLDKVCGLKGFRKGNVGLFEKQALVLVNYGRENSLEIKNFVAEITNIVFEKTGLKIEPEVNFLE